MPAYLFAFDGGGSGSRAVLADTAGNILSQAQGGPAALSLGLDAAHTAINTLLLHLFQHIKQPAAPQHCTAVLGMAGAHHPGWRSAFAAQCPAFAHCQVLTDGDTSLAGAHAGYAGAIVAIGTGVVGEALATDGTRRTVSGWGFPSGDEGGGAWLGLQVARQVQHSFDGRQTRSPLTEQALAQVGHSPADWFDWLGCARATDYANLAPLVFACAGQDAFAARLLQAAGAEIEGLAQALDPSGQLPLALLGGLAEPLLPWLPPALLARCAPPQGDALSGALKLAQNLAASAPTGPASRPRPSCPA